jgi:hypothetical protein
MIGKLEENVKGEWKGGTFGSLGPIRAFLGSAILTPSVRPLQTEFQEIFHQGWVLYPPAKIEEGGGWEISIWLEIG